MVSNGRRVNILETTSVAAFGEATVPLGMGFKLTGGIRFNHDMKEYDSQYFGSGFPGTVDSFAESGQLDYDFVTGRVSLAHDINRREAVYATLSRGEKSGGFPRLIYDAIVGQATAPFKSTEILAYEGGYRYRAPGGGATFSAAMFLNEVTNEQLYVFDSATFTFRPNNIDTRSFGLELKSELQLASALRLTAGLGLTRATLEDVPADIQQSSGAENGNRPPNVSEVTAFARLDYREKAPWLGLGPDTMALSDLGWSYVGDRAANVANDFFLKDFNLIDARVGLSLHPGWEVYLFGRNLLDVIPEQFGTSAAPGVEAVVPERGRVTGIGLAAKW